MLQNHPRINILSLPPEILLIILDELSLTKAIVVRQISKDFQLIFNIWIKIQLGSPYQKEKNPYQAFLYTIKIIEDILKTEKDCRQDRNKKIKEKLVARAHADPKVAIALPYYEKAWKMLRHDLSYLVDIDIYTSQWWRQQLGLAYQKELDPRAAFSKEINTIKDTVQTYGYNEAQSIIVERAKTDPKVAIAALYKMYWGFHIIIEVVKAYIDPIKKEILQRAVTRGMIEGWIEGKELTMLRRYGAKLMQEDLDQAFIDRIEKGMISEAEIFIEQGAKPTKADLDRVRDRFRKRQQIWIVRELDELGERFSSGLNRDIKYVYSH